MNKPIGKIILAIETSCDETAAAVLEMRDDSKWPQIKTFSSVVKSQIDIHSKMGGVVPEAAARAHVKNILPITKKSLQNIFKTNSFFDGRQKMSWNKKNQSLKSIDYIAVTTGPGLMPSLIVGVEFAKGLAFALKKPIIPVNHMLGHLYSPLVSRVALDTFPMISLIVSGGHTMLVLMTDIKNYKVLGQTVDDAAGEAFDKVAKLLGLPYPGGPEVSKLAADGTAKTITFPRPMINSKNYNFSFSGLKTAVLYYVQSLNTKHLSLSTKADICKAFQDAAVDVLVTKTMRAAKEYKAKSISLSGGVAANQALRESFTLNSQLSTLNFFVPQKNLCTDNAEMIGLAAAFMLHNGYRPKSYKQIKADPNLEL